LYPKQILDGLNPPQKEATLHVSGPMLVIAGAGAGKTKTAIHRLAYLLSQGAPPESILCITFTNKAAKEMRERAIALVGPEANLVMIRTFHAAAVILLRESLHQYSQCGRTRSFSIANPAAQLSLIKQAIAERGFDLKEQKPESYLWRIGRYKNEMADPDTLLYRKPTTAFMDWPRVQGLMAGTDRYVNRLTAEIWRGYEKGLQVNNQLDFDDLINLFVQLLRDLPEVRSAYQDRFRYIQVDEFQDTNIAQLQMIKLLSGDKQNVMAVGDDSQSIYSWRSADIRCILGFEGLFPGARTVTLNQNYRSTASIVRVANQLIAHNTAQLPKQLFTEAGDGWPVNVYDADNDDDEARYVVTEIKKMAAAGRPYAHFSILYRTNVQSRIFEDKFREEGIPYQVVGGPRFYDRREIQDALAYLRLLDNPRDATSLERVAGAPRRGLGEKALKKVMAHAAHREVDLVASLELSVRDALLTDQAAAGATRIHSLLYTAQRSLTAGQPFPTVIETLLKESGFIAALEADDRQKEERRSEMVRSVLTSMYDYHARRFDSTLREYLEKLTLSDAQDDDNGGDQIRMMTIHASKGLEYPVVFVIGMEQGILPNRRALAEDNLEEERRLCYVAFTRARELLYLTSAKIRSERGEFNVTTPSQFLAEALTS